MNKKKLVVVLASLVAVLTLAIGGTLAYFTDTDFNENVMTTGRVEIDQIEYQRNENGELEDFTDDHIMLPAVGDNNDDGKLDVAYDDAEESLFAQSRNVIDKMITVKNTGNLDAYVRTLIAFEVPAMVDGYKGDTLTDVNGAKYIDVVNVAPYLYTIMNEGATAGKGYTLPKEGDAYVIIEKDGTNYLVTEYYYKANGSKLAPGEETIPCLKQVYMSAAASNESAALMFGADKEYKILALSQAVQVSGFETVTAEAALDKAFGDVTTANATEWFANATSKGLSADA